MFITRHTRLGDANLRDRLWRFYRGAYARNPILPTTEVVDRAEFDDTLLNATNRVWVVWEGDRPVVMTLIATDIASTRWLNPEPFRRHHAERMRRGLVHYVIWVVVDPDVEVRGANVALAREALTAEARDGALLVFDLPGSQQPDDAGGAAEPMLRMAKVVGDVELVPLATVRYYALDFAQSPPRGGADDTDKIQEDMSTTAT
jgi:hypothetical protein